MAGEYLGRVAVYDRDFISSSNQAIAKLTLKKGYEPHYVSTYLNTKYGQHQISRLKTITGQPNINMGLISELKIILLSDAFQKKLTEHFTRVEAVTLRSKDIYQQAEQILLVELGLANFAPSAEPVAVKSFSDSFGVSWRLDAEYYQPKYEDYEVAIKATHKLVEICDVHDSAFEPHKNDYKYIELSDIGTSGNITGSTIAPFDELPSRARRLVKSGQVIVSSIEGSLSSCALITNEYDGAICSTGFYVVDSAKINSETLLIIFKSELIQQLMKQRCSGTILSAVSKTAFENMPFPLISKEKQREIANMVQKSFALRQQSEQLLDMAKRATEIAIEDGEKKAIIWLKTREGLNEQYNKK
jgi:restriction endonuclease S subunit